MIFQFSTSPVVRNPAPGSTWPGLKQVFGAWQKALAGQGWNALFIENHDIPRAGVAVGRRWSSTGATAPPR